MRGRGNKREADASEESQRCRAGGAPTPFTACPALSTWSCQGTGPEAPEDSGLRPRAEHSSAVGWHRPGLRLASGSSGERGGVTSLRADDRDHSAQTQTN